MKLKQLLYEAGILDKYAFADDSGISYKFYGGKTETNNDFENELYAALKDWVNNSRDTNLYNLIKVNRNKLIKDYPEIFKPKTPNGTTLYRGLKTISDNMIFSLGNPSPQDWQMSDLIKNGYTYKEPIKYTPNKFIQSWTNSFITADEFAKTAVLETTQNSEFFMNYDAISYIYDGYKEYECLHFGKDYHDSVFLHITDNVFSETFSDVDYNKNEEIDDTMRKLGIKNYKIRDGVEVEVNGDVDISNLGLKKIPVRIHIVNGSFNCENNLLTDLKNAPSFVYKDFNCSNNPELNSLKGAEDMFLYGDFICKNTPKLKSFDYLPTPTKGHVYTDNN